MRLPVILILLFFISCEEKDVNLPPTPFTVELTELSQTTASLGWYMPVDPEGGEVLFDVYLNDVLLHKHISTDVYDLKNLNANTLYHGKVVAFDIKNNQTVAPFTFTTLEYPGTSLFNVVIVDITGSFATLKWLESLDPEGGKVTYAVYLDNTLVAQNITDLQYTLTGLSNGVAYTGKVAATGTRGIKTEVAFSFTSTPLTSYLLVQYPLCGNAQDAVHGNHGTLVGTVVPASDRHGVDNCAYLFPGTATDYISVPYSEDFNLNPSKDFSISVWFQGGTDDIGDLEFFLIKENPAVAPIRADYHVGLYDCNAATFGNYSPVIGANLDACGPDPNPTWRHAVFVYKYGVRQFEQTYQRWTIYIDGSFAAHRETTEAITQSNGGVKIGQYFKGRIDEINIFSKALTEGDVLTVYGW